MEVGNGETLGELETSDGWRRASEGGFSREWHLGSLPPGAPPGEAGRPLMIQLKFKQELVRA